MAATRTRAKKPVTADVALDEAPVTVAAPPARKYFSHANCDHARQGEAGKAARAACRNAHKAWLKAEAEFLGQDVAIAV